MREAVTIGKCKIDGTEAVLGVCDARFLMGSMGYVVGEKLREQLKERRSFHCLSFYSVVPEEPECRKGSYR